MQLLPCSTCGDGTGRCSVLKSVIDHTGDNFNRQQKVSVGGGSQIHRDSVPPPRSGSCRQCRQEGFHPGFLLFSPPHT